MNARKLEKFQSLIQGYYDEYKRNLPWRQAEMDGSFDAYKILVSEIMLQQTQVLRVTPKYHEFLEQFPSAAVLANASLSDVLKVWSGLGYNRRAKFLWQAAKAITIHHKSQVPRTIQELIALPGVGPNTAGAIMAYAYNQPVVFIETNIRTVFIHHFFSDRHNVSDKQILEVLEQTLPVENPREFYWALMDYGSYLKTNVGNLSKLSQTHKKQLPFEGSKRQVRGQIVRTLIQRQYSLDQLRQLISDARLEDILAKLEQEGIVEHSKGRYKLA